jgi:SAM-dependent methyltransferase
MATEAATHSGSGGPIIVGDAAALPLPDAVADCVVAFMSLQDIDEMEMAVAEAARVLSAGGHFVIAITHPLNTAGQFVTGADEGSRPFVIEGSWFERKALADTCERDGFTMTFHTEHRPLQDYTNALADAGFVIERIHEVGEPNHADKWHRIPLFLHVRAVRL